MCLCVLECSRSVCADVHVLVVCVLMVLVMCAQMCMCVRMQVCVCDDAQLALMRAEWGSCQCCPLLLLIAYHRHTLALCDERDVDHWHR